jgi:hypothetical protein
VAAFVLSLSTLFALEKNGALTHDELADISSFKTRRN